MTSERWQHHNVIFTQRWIDLLVKSTRLYFQFVEYYISALENQMLVTLYTADTYCI